MALSSFFFHLDRTMDEPMGEVVTHHHSVTTKKTIMTLSKRRGAIKSARRYAFKLRYRHRTSSAHHMGVTVAEVSGMPCSSAKALGGLPASRSAAGWVSLTLALLCNICMPNNTSNMF